MIKILLDFEVLSLIIVNIVCGYWFGIEWMKDLVAVWSMSLLSYVLFIFALVLFSINLIVWSLIDNDLGFGPSDIEWLLI